MSKLESSCKCISPKEIISKLSSRNIPDQQMNVIKESINVCKSNKKKRRCYIIEWIFQCKIKNTAAVKYLRANNLLPLCEISTVKRYLRAIDLILMFFFNVQRKNGEKNKNIKDMVVCSEMKWFSELVLK